MFSRGGDPRVYPGAGAGGGHPGEPTRKGAAGGLTGWIMWYGWWNICLPIWEQFWQTNKSDMSHRIPEEPTNLPSSVSEIILE